jgi:hypothetical protein
MASTLQISTVIIYFFEEKYSDYAWLSIAGPIAFIMGMTMSLL